MGWHKDSLIKERQNRKAKEIAHPLPQTDQCSASVQTMSILEKNSPFRLLLPLLRLFLLRMLLYGMKYTFDQFWSAVPGVSSLSLSPIPSLLAERAEWGKRKS